MMKPRLVWDSKNEPKSTKPVSAFDRVRVVEVDPADAELPPEVRVYVTERWNGTAACGEDQWREMGGNQTPPPEMVRALVRMADAEASADVAGLSEDYLKTEAKLLGDMRAYFRGVARNARYTGESINAFRVPSMLSDAAWEHSRAHLERDNPFADEPTNAVDVPDLGKALYEKANELPPVLDTESPPEPTAHVETDERTDDEIPY